MPNTTIITSAVYAVLAANAELASHCTIYRGERRPSASSNPSVTIHAKRLERSEGDGIWMCDVIVTVYADTLPNRMIDQNTHDVIASRISTLLDDAELDLAAGHAHPLIAGGVSDPEWSSRHDRETTQALTFGLLFVDFGVTAE
jgi:hypothetical protein